MTTKLPCGCTLVCSGHEVKDWKTKEAERKDILEKIDKWYNFHDTDPYDCGEGGCHCFNIEDLKKELGQQDGSVREDEPVRRPDRGESCPKCSVCKGIIEDGEPDEPVILCLKHYSERLRMARQEGRGEAEKKLEYAIVYLRSEIEQQIIEEERARILKIIDEEITRQETHRKHTELVAPDDLEWHDAKLEVLNQLKEKIEGRKT